MLQLGIQPMATMFHWDMPVWAGNLREREVAYHMADYAHVLTRHFGDRIPMWAILNEPGSVAFAGYMLGIHAPGLASADSTGAAIHHQNLAQGLMAQAAQANLNEHHILTTTISVAPIRPSVHHPVDPALIKKADDFWNRAFLDPMYGKGYPLILIPMVSKFIQNNDLINIVYQPMI